MVEGQLVSSISSSDNIHEFMFEVDASFFLLGDDSCLFVEKFKSKRVAKHVESPSKSFVSSCAEINQICDGLFKIAGIWCVAVVSVLFGNEIVGLMWELIFNDVLESIEEKRSELVDNEIVICVVEFMAGPVVEFMFDEIPILESEHDVVVSPGAAWLLWFFDSIADVGLIVVEIVELLHDVLVVVGCQDEIVGIGDDLEGCHAD